MTISNCIIHCSMLPVYSLGSMSTCSATLHHYSYTHAASWATLLVDTHVCTYLYTSNVLQCTCTCKYAFTPCCHLIPPTDNPCLTNATAVEYGWDVYCPSHPQVCVSATWRCNGIVDCEGLEDEMNCCEFCLVAV